jgi:glycosyltransferase involved in cell wall biosynthesis
VLLEALDAGVPVIASNAKGPSDVLSRFPGDLFPAGDVDALAVLLRRHAALGRRSKTPRDLSAYAQPLIAERTEAAYRELVYGSSTSPPPPR